MVRKVLRGNFLKISHQNLFSENKKKNTHHLHTRNQWKRCRWVYDGGEEKKIFSVTMSKSHKIEKVSAPVFLGFAHALRRSLHCLSRWEVSKYHPVWGILGRVPNWRGCAWLQCRCSCALLGSLTSASLNLGRGCVLRGSRAGLTSSQRWDSNAGGDDGTACDVKLEHSSPLGVLVGGRISTS